MAFERGLSALNKAVSQQQQGGSFSSRLGNFSWKDGDKKILRFLSNDIIIGQFYEWIAVYNEKAPKVAAMDFLIDPDGADWVRRLGGKTREFGTGNLVAPRATKRGIAVAVLRTEVSDGDGRKRPIDFEKSIDVPSRDGKAGGSFPAHEFGIVKQSLGNFWDQFLGMADRYGTICDRDFEVTRIGKDKHTRYGIAPLEPIDGLRELEQVQAAYGYGRKFSEDDPERYLFCPQTLDEWAEYYSSEERARFWLGSGNGNGTPQQDGDAEGLDEFSPSTTSNPDVWGRPAGIGGADDEAQPVPSQASAFADLKSSLLPYLNKTP